jgi:hypothetical protein
VSGDQAEHHRCGVGVVERSDLFVTHDQTEVADATCCGRSPRSILRPACGRLFRVVMATI